MAQIIQHPNTITIEDRLTLAGQETVAHAKALTIENDEVYQEAGAYLRVIKTQSKEITEYWSAPKSRAMEAHREIVAKEKAMLQPLTEAETIIKRSMSAYQQAVEAKRRAEEAELRRKQQEERDRLLAEAADAEENGDVLTAETTMIIAEMVEDIKPVVVSSAPKAAGISTRKTWKARIVDENAVPVVANGITIRPIDMSALNKLAVLTKGTGTIPGVEFYEDVTLAVR